MVSIIPLFGFCVRTSKSHPYMCLLNPPSVMYIIISLLLPLIIQLLYIYFD